MKKVFSNWMVAHVWAQQRKPAGRSGNGNFYFHDVTIYSYGSHFPIATFTDDAHGNRCVLFTTDSYGNSTAKHINHTRSALDGLSLKVWSVAAVRSSGNGKPNEYTHKDNVLVMAKQAAERAAELARPLKRARYYNEGDLPEVQFRERMIEKIVGELVEYCDAFAVAVPDSVTLVAWQDTIRAAFAKHNDPKIVAKREKSREASKRRRQLLSAAAYTRFHAFMEGVHPFITNDDYKQLDRSEQYEYRRQTYRVQYAERKHRPRTQITAEQWCDGVNGELPYGSCIDTRVRKNGERLETSRGAECPWQHAIIAFLKAQQCRRLGVEWHSNGEQVRVGHFRVDSINKLGDIRAGCHTLKYDEMLRLAVREVPELVKATYALPVAA